MPSQNKKIVKDQEKLYRSIAPYRNPYKKIDGKLRISSQAFSDRNYEPSVDRAELCAHNPHYTKKSETAGVVYLLAKDVRDEKIFSKQPTGDINYSLDVKAAPSQNNKAHALIIGIPKYKTSNIFRKAQERLAILAEKNGWRLIPEE
jgi:hypothetical protein